MGTCKTIKNRDHENIIMREGESCGVNNRSGHKKTNNTDETDKFVRETDITEMGGVIHASIFRTDF